MMATLARYRMLSTTWVLLFVVVGIVMEVRA